MPVRGDIRWSRRGQRPLIFNGVNFVPPSLWGRHPDTVRAALRNGFGNIHDYFAWTEQQRVARGRHARQQREFRPPRGGGRGGRGRSLQQALANLRGAKGGRVPVSGTSSLQASGVVPHPHAGRHYGLRPSGYMDHMLVQQGLQDRVGIDVDIGPVREPSAGQSILDQMTAENTLSAEGAVDTSGAVVNITEDGYTGSGGFGTATQSSVMHVANSLPSTDNGQGEWAKSLLMKGVVGDVFELFRNPVVNGSAAWDSSDNVTVLTTLTSDGPGRIITLGREGFAIVDLEQVVGAPNGATHWAVRCHQDDNQVFASFFQREGDYDDLIVGPRS